VPQGAAPLTQRVKVPEIGFRDLDHGVRDILLTGPTAVVETGEYSL
jgi:hypothetical protein